MIVVLLSTVVFRNFNHTNEKGQHLIQKVEVISNHLIQTLESIHNYLLSSHLLADNLGGGVESKVDFQGCELELLDGVGLAGDAAGGAIHQHAVLVDHVHDRGDLASVGPRAKHGHAPDLYKLFKRHL